MTVRRLAAKDCSQSCGLTSKGLSLCLFELNYRMREKAVIGDDGSQVSRKGLSTVVRTNLERLEPMPFRTQLQDVRKESQ